MKEKVKRVLNFKKPSRVIIAATIALVAVLSVGFALNKASENDLLEFEVIFSDVTEYSRTEQFKLGDTLYSIYIVNGQIQTAGGTRWLKQVGVAFDDFGKYRIYERQGYSIDEFITVQDYGFMNPAIIYAADYSPSGWFGNPDGKEMTLADVRPLPEQPQYEVGNVTVISNGWEYEPYTHIYFNETLTANGMVSTETLPLSLEEAAGILPEIQITDDFRVVIAGEYASSVLYSLYDINDNRFNLVYDKEDTIKPFLDLSGTSQYMLFVYVIWSNSEIEQQNREAIGFQYVFKVST